MMDWTDRHCRFFHRLLTRQALIYTEMLTTGAVLHGDRPRLLGLDPAAAPGPGELGGCDRVQEARVGACLIAEPELGGDCVVAMKAKVGVPVTVKCRIGIDDQDPEQALSVLTGIVRQAGVDALIVHARKAWLAG